MMKLIGLTGGIGCGKSFLAHALIEQGIPVVDTDHLARQLLSVGQPALDPIRRKFGDSVFEADGQLNRMAVSDRIFQNHEDKKWLEELLHPMIRSQWNQMVIQWEEQGKETGVVVIPLLFETDAQKSFDSVICMACAPATQMQRLLARGWSQNQIQNRLGAQWPLARKMSMSDHVIWTDVPEGVTIDQWNQIIDPTD